MPSSTQAKLVVTDSRKASLYTASVTRERADAPPSVRLELVDTVNSPWEEFHEHGRPSTLGRGSGPGGPPHSVGEGHEREEFSKRFATEVSAWLGRHANGGPAYAWVAFADPKFLGHLRTACAAQRLDVTVERGEFSWLRPAELAAHPAIRAALGSAAFPSLQGR